MIHVIGYLWWYWNEDILNPLIMVPPKAIPPFWHAIFAVLLNGMAYSLSFTVYLQKILLSVISVRYRHIFLTSWIAYKICVHVHVMED